MVAGRLAGMAAALTAALTGTAAGAAAKPAVCGPREALIERLERAQGETRRAVGLRDGAGVIEIFASERTGAWTIVLSRTDGSACAVASGEAWHEVEALVGRAA